MVKTKEVVTTPPYPIAGRHGQGIRDEGRDGSGRQLREVHAIIGQRYSAIRAADAEYCPRQSGTVIFDTDCTDRIAIAIGEIDVPSLIKGNAFSNLENLLADMHRRVLVGVIESKRDHQRRRPIRIKAIIIRIKGIGSVQRQEQRRIAGGEEFSRRPCGELDAQIFVRQGDEIELGKNAAGKTRQIIGGYCVVREINRIAFLINKQVARGGGVRIYFHIPRGGKLAVYGHSHRRRYVRDFRLVIDVRDNHVDGVCQQFRDGCGVSAQIRVPRRDLHGRREIGMPTSGNIRRRRNAKGIAVDDLDSHPSQGTAHGRGETDPIAFRISDKRPELVTGGNKRILSQSDRA